MVKHTRMKYGAVHNIDRFQYQSMNVTHLYLKGSLIKLFYIYKRA